MLHFITVTPLYQICLITYKNMNQVFQKTFTSNNLSYVTEEILLDLALSYSYLKLQKSNEIYRKINFVEPVKGCTR